MGYEIGMDEGHDCQVQFQILHTCKQVQLRYALVNHEHKHVFPLQGPMFVKPVSCKKRSFFWNCLIALLLRLAAQQCTQPQSSTYGGHECEEDVRCHGGVPESTNVWVCLLL